MKPEESISNSGSPEPSIPPPSHPDLEKRFKHHPPTGNKGALHTSMREECKALAYTICALVPEGRERALALTKLEEVMMWSNAAIARS